MLDVSLTYVGLILFPIIWTIALAVYIKNAKSGGTIHRMYRIGFELLMSVSIISLCAFLFFSGMGVIYWLLP